jgi:hypothetical protein
MSCHKIVVVPIEFDWRYKSDRAVADVITAKATRMTTMVMRDVAYEKML